MHPNSSVQVITLSDDSSSESDTNKSHKTPAPRTKCAQEPKHIATNIHGLLETPELPSPTMLLLDARARNPENTSPTRSGSITSKHSSSDRGCRGTSAQMTRQAALELPSSPPLDSIGFTLPGSIHQSDCSDDDCQILDGIISATEANPRFDSTPPYISSLESGSRVFNSTTRMPIRSVDFSDTVATEILSSSSDGNNSDTESVASTTSLLARSAQAIAKSQGTQTISPMSDPPTLDPQNAPIRRSFSLDSPVSIPTSDNANAQNHRPQPSRISRLLSSSLLDSSSSTFDLATSSLLAKPNPTAAKKQLETERKKAERVAAKEQREWDRRFARELSQANRKTTDLREVARDMTVVVGAKVIDTVDGPRRPGVQRANSTANDEASAPCLLSQKSSTVDNTTTIAGGGDEKAEHVLFDRLIEDGIKYKVESMDNCAIRWEMLVRRKWDPLMNLYVPLQSPTTVKVKTAAMIILTSAKFLEMVAHKRVKSLAEIWRASLAVKRVFVVVLGLQKELRKSSTVGTREFDRQMRVLLRDGHIPANSGTQNNNPSGVCAEDTVDQVLLELQVSCSWITWFTQCADTRALAQLIWRTTVDMALHETRAKDVCDLDDCVEQPAAMCFITRDMASSLHATLVKSGASLSDSWVRALTQIPKVTLLVAQSIAAAYPTPQRLFDAWAAKSLKTEREQLLSAIVVSSAASVGRRLGSVMSARIYQVFNEPDPSKPFADL
ncbi:hypothetical protein GGI25_004213 [Coemansia spiralis]|uniref:ERCC4 domain-containing protein n=2 Tax=Coemansia TaxID=4863 RepID=A0A9W8KVT4_9FUNG|nr:hypothetical protein EDC05_004192 [Coemansia umbellata]KAJ2624980.1 hypothetical protein GGI26_001092 [Coemansia sp. RSA 1358]KAJ2674826.1 hypothetical protein GGI25_004213 [Coemansia spiralis]